MQKNSFIKKVSKCMGKIAPLELAECWDNTGIIAESPLHIGNNVLLTVDLTSDVVEEAIAREAGVVVSYHPPWFQSAKKLTLDGPLSLVSECICKGISLYSPHTVHQLHF
jgi:putative NIF3 family GTP cyclohydrolase 1 type 2